MRLVANGPGIGDSVFLSAVAHEWLRQRTEALTLSVAHPEIYDHFPGVVAVPWDGPEHRSFPELDDQRVTQGEHNVTWMCRSLGLHPPTEIRQRMYFGLHEGLVEFRERYATVHVQPGPWTRTRDWVLERWNQLVRHLLSHGIPVVQVGGRSDPALSFVMANRTGVSLRRSAAIISRARLHVGCVSGLMHVASAVGTPSVIIYGGREDPKVTGYPGNVNLTTDPEQQCSPCWLLECPYRRTEGDEERRPCTDMVSVDQVFESVRAMWRAK